MQSSGQPFSYEKYKLIQDAVVVNICLERLAELNSDFRRYVRPLKEAGIESTNDLMHCHGSLLYPASFIFQCDYSHFCPSGASALYLTP